jgi:LacI family transcriptional regulator
MIAEKLQLSPMTVSRALRNHPAVNSATLQRVRDCAEKLGYRPDPMLSSLTRYRRNTPGTLDYNQIAFLTNFSSEHGWKEASDIRLLYEGALGAAEEMGYTLVPYWLRQPRQKNKSLSDILYHRGIRGALLALHTPHMAKGHLRLDWDRFSVISLGPSPGSPELSSIVFDAAHAVRLACHHLRRLGFQRIGFAHYDSTNAQQDNLPLASFLGEQWRYPRSGKIRPFVWRKEGLEEMLVWVEREKPDVLLTNRCGPGSHPQEISRRRKRTERPLPCYYYSLYENDPTDVSGVLQPLPQLGRQGLLTLHSHLQRGQRGVPTSPYTLTFKGAWRSEGAAPLKG